MTNITCEQALWDTLEDGTEIHRFTIRGSDNDSTVTVSDLGATLVNWTTPDRQGRQGDIVLGFATPQGYLDSSTHMGGTIGRWANRIADARFTLDERSYSLEANDGHHSLHGGSHGFDRRVWQSDIRPDGVRFTRVSPDGEAGFPGALTVQITYAFDGEHLRIEYDAQSTAATPLNLTNHSYFNLTGGPGTAKGHHVQILADTVLLPDASGIPQGGIAVADTRFDLRPPTLNTEAIGEQIDADALLRARGQSASADMMPAYDHCFVLSDADTADTPLRRVARAFDPVSGRALDVSTTERSVQFYTAGNLGGVHDRLGTRQAFDAICFETQAFPNQINGPHARSVILRPGAHYRQITEYRASVDPD